MSIVESYYPYEAIVAAYENSLDAITVASGNNLTAGYVIQKSHALSACKLTMAAGTNTGNGTLTLAKAGPEVKVGTYTVTCTSVVTNGGVFSVTDPDSAALPSLTLTVGAGASTWYSHPQMGFLVTEGSTDFAVDDSFTVVVATSTAPTAVGTGNGTLTSLAFGKDAKPGSYRATCIGVATHGGTFDVTGPDGYSLGTIVMTAGAGTATTWAAQRDIVSFILTDASTDFVVGDYFEAIAAKAATYNHYVPFLVSNGSTPVGVLLADVDATSAAKAGLALVRNGVVKASALKWSSSPTAGSKSVAYAKLLEANVTVQS